MCLLASRAYADAALLLAEPYNRPGRLNPVAHAGHAGVYLTRDLRHHVDDAASVPRGEAGVVISRYDQIGKFALRSGAPRTFD